MKLVAFSDPHIDIQEKRGYPNFLSKLTNHLESLEPDVILVTGDVAGSTTYVQKFLEGINTTVKKKIFCPGNHDIWVNSKSHDASWVKYYQILPELCNEFEWHYLPNQPIGVDNVAFVGSMGWYDYSTRNPVWDNEISLQEYSTKSNKMSGGVWMDREYAKFGDYSDKDVADHLASELISDLQKISKDILRDLFEASPSKLEEFDIYKTANKDKFRNIDTVVIGTHMVPFYEFVKFTGNLDWDYFSAFIGNTTLGRIIESINRDLRKVSVFGHTHFPQRKMLKNNVEAICCPIGYPNEWERHHKDLESLFENRIITIDI